MARLLTLLLICASTFTQGQDLPKWAYHSTITPKQRMEGLQKVLDMLGEDAKKNKQSKAALEHLENDSAVCEPLGEDGKGNPAMRFIATQDRKWNKKTDFIVVPLFAVDAKAGGEIKEFLEAGDTPVVGTDGSQLYINLDHLKVKNAVSLLAGAILTEPVDSNQKMEIFRKVKG